MSILFHGISHELPEHVRQTLRSNDRLSWLQSFHPANETEAAVLCSMGKYGHPDRLVLGEQSVNKEKTTAQLHELFDNTPDESLRDKLHEDGYYILNDNDQYYCIDFANKVILNMEEAGLDVDRLKRRQTKQENARINPSSPQQSSSKPNILRPVRKALQQQGGSKDSSREHEVGGHGNYDEIDDERKLKR